MGNKQTIFTEEQLDNYQDCTFFNKKDILKALGTDPPGSLVASLLCVGSPHHRSGHTQAAGLWRPVAVSALAARACPRRLAAASPPPPLTTFLHPVHTHCHLLRERPPTPPALHSCRCSPSVLQAQVLGSLQSCSLPGPRFPALSLSAVRVSPQ
ncbi:calcium and integrin-binding family member 2 isoform X10 [Eumetopias jubatus]|uniref:calcium and integrin-binding family member 2 isoform X10 n=1 Tax=Eumetopias jubatus TaxID=34886 RepID=UPI00101671AB|nr:calcium and integrin-binding family member 2 isoform X10 [Eumetopias jubatus]